MVALPLVCNRGKTPPVRPRPNHPPGCTCPWLASRQPEWKNSRALGLKEPPNRPCRSRNLSVAHGHSLQTVQESPHGWSFSFLSRVGIWGFRSMDERQRSSGYGAFVPRPGRWSHVGSNQLPQSLGRNLVEAAIHAEGTPDPRFVSIAENPPGNPRFQGKAMRRCAPSPLFRKGSCVRSRRHKNPRQKAMLARVLACASWRGRTHFGCGSCLVGWGAGARNFSPMCKPSGGVGKQSTTSTHSTCLQGYQEPEAAWTESRQNRPRVAMSGQKLQELREPTWSIWNWEAAQTLARFSGGPPGVTTSPLNKYVACSLIGLLEPFAT